MSDTNIIPLFDGSEAVVPNQPVACVVDLLRDYLAQAEAGDVTGVLIAVVRPNRNVGTQWAEAGGYRNELATGALLLSARVGQVLLED